MLEFKLGVLDGSPCEIQAFILHKSIETNPLSPTREDFAMQKFPMQRLDSIHFTLVIV